MTNNRVPSRPFIHFVNRRVFRENISKRLYAQQSRVCYACALFFPSPSSNVSSWTTLWRRESGEENLRHAIEAGRALSHIETVEELLNHAVKCLVKEKERIEKAERLSCIIMYHQLIVRPYYMASACVCIHIPGLALIGTSACA